MKKSEVRKPFLEMVESVVIPIGFVKQKTNEGYEYIKKDNYGFVGIIPCIDQYDTLFFISLAFQLRIHEVSEILVCINNISNEFKDGYPSLSFGLNSLVEIEDNRIKAETPEELADALKFLKNVLEKEGVVFFESIKSVDELDKEINRENRHKDLYCNEISIRPFVGLTSAVLNKNPQSKYWENYYREKLKCANQHIKNQYEKLVEYLKNNYPGSLT